MSAKKDLTNQTFGYMYVMYQNGVNNQKHAIWHCKCLLCGNEKDVVSSSLIRGKSTKCRSCATSLSKMKEYSHDSVKILFKGMKQRCYNPNTRSFVNYGARGITICDEWLDNPISFYDWAYSNGYKKGMSIERKDVNKGYSPDNCMFIPKNEQSKNRTVSIMITIDNKTLCLTDWCRIYNKNVSTVKHRHDKQGMSWIDALEK